MTSKGGFCQYMNKRMSFSVASTPIITILNQIKTVQFGGLDLQPEYQRAYIWKDDFKDKLIYSLIKDYPIGNISVRVLELSNSKGAKSEVVDGQQRLTTIQNFINGDYVIKCEWSKKIIEEIQSYFGEIEDEKLSKLSKKLSNKRNITLKFSDLPDIIQGNINSYNISVSYIANSSNTEIREYFMFLQNQERLKAGEIINSIPDTILETHLNMLSNKDNLLNIIGFGDDRREFDKIFYSIIGLFDNKISFGTTDKIIQKYVSESTMPLDNNNYIKNMISNLNLISNLDTPIATNVRKRFVKYLLLLCGFNFINESIDLKKALLNLSLIDNKLSAFFSAKANIEEETFIEYSPDVIDELRCIALLSKGSHPLDRVFNRMSMLEYYIINDNPLTAPSNIIPIEIQDTLFSIK